MEACNAGVELGNRDAQGGGTFVAEGGAAAGGQPTIGNIVGGPTSVFSVCGDGKLESGEGCDDANTISGASSVSSVRPLASA